MISRNKQYFLTALFSLVFITLAIVVSIYFQNKNKLSDNLEETIKKTSFPLSSSSEGENLASFDCTITKNKDVNINYPVSEQNFKNIKIILLTECEYFDSNEKKQILNLITGALYSDSEGLKLSYGGNVYKEPITDPKNATAKLIIRDIEVDTKIRYQLDQLPTFGKGEKLTISLSMPDNNLIENSIMQATNLQISKYTYDYLISDWQEQKSFWETGDIQYLPNLENGEKIIPAFGIYWLK